jgi:NAD(P)-dependent dehydrogenase (short-subunit alcohol dehydrogenase family)
MAAAQHRVVVVTDASSGLGRAIAMEFARQGCALVLAARRDDSLEDPARLCLAAGGSALAVAADVTVEADVAALAFAALDRWGRIDVWINNAGVTLYALLEQAPLEQHRQVIEVNLFGAMIGARTVVPVFRRQHRGVLIIISSVLGGVGQAFVPSYVISKFGVHGLSEALRVELADEPDTHVCTVFPYAIDTPHFEVAANRFGIAPRALPPVQLPEKVAAAVARLADHPRRTCYVPRGIRLGVGLHALAPRSTERLLLDALRTWHLTEPQQVGTGNLFAPAAAPGKLHGDRRPLLSTGQFAAWLVGRLVQLQIESGVRVARRVQARLLAGYERLLARRRRLAPATAREGSL